MIAAAVLALSIVQKPVLPPAFPPGTSPEFARLALAVEGKLIEGDVAEARELAKALPTRTPRLVWREETPLPPDLKAAREASLARALVSWTRAVKAFAPSEKGEGAGLSIGFQDVLPAGPDGLPLATQAKSGAPFQATIGLHRGAPKVPIRREDLTVELAYVLGRYLGVPEAPLPGSAMHRDARPNLLPLMPQHAEIEVAAANLALAEQLRAGVEAGKPIGLTVPTIRLPQPRLDLGEVPQGRPLQTRLPIENLGAGTLSYRVEPDCSCFDTMLPGKIDSQGRGSVPVIINTLEYVGRQDKVLLVLSNDPERPQIEVPVSFTSRPAYRFFRPGGPNVVVPNAGGAFDVFYYSDPKDPIEPISYRWDGTEAKVTMSPWVGKLADPELKEGPLVRQGWRFRVQFPKAEAGAMQGREPGTLVVSTDSDLFGTAMYAMTAQRGIVADPVFLGNVSRGTRASFLVSRPNVPFKILSVDAGKGFKTAWKLRRPGDFEYQIDLEYVGGRPKGELLMPIRIHTNDPKQPLVETLLSGTLP